ncbi:hypothetical protein F966_01966 [Acinetobacter higginsii]|uniref:Uncharacterized protein n=1 Tax=Acinetobacter higginsii TaxID=70347 RepID=N8XQG0_9GAMM|nr:hypothetical protein [Acinetobacter higginsii]ENV09310.1 hypothetical protein F966_01966 [Acinetobacter higginsii]
MSQPRDPKYSWVFQELTKNDQGQFNLESIVAYTIYKKHKIDFINQIKNRHNRDPEDQEWLIFHTQCELESSLKGFRDQATLVVSNLLDVALTAEISALEDQALLESKVNSELAVVNTKLTTIDGYINEKKGAGWWFSQVGQNFLVNILTIFIIGGFATFVLNFNKVSEWFGKLFP